MHRLEFKNVVVTNISDLDDPFSRAAEREPHGTLKI